MTAREWLRKRPWIHLWLPVVAWMGLIFYLSAQPDLPQPRMGWLDQLISSAAHAFMFGVLAVLWARVLGRRRHALWIALAVTVAYALSDELHQVFVPGRHADPWDLVCDGLGATLSLLALAWWRRLSSSSGRGAAF